MTRVLITGAEGFVGGYLRARLSKAGMEVLAGTAAPLASHPASRAFDLVDESSVDALVKWAAPIHHVVHLAAITFVPDAARSPAHVMDVNLGGTIRLLDAVTRYSPGARVLFVGSSEAYGRPQSLPITESHPLNPLNPYAISKAAADHYCASLSANHSIAIVRARPFNHSGAGQSDAFALSSFARQIAEIEAGRRPPVLTTGNLDVARDFSHVADVVAAYALLLESGEPGDAYNVCSGQPVSLRVIVDRLLALSSAKIEVETDPERLRKTDVEKVFGSNDKISKTTGWRPQRDLATLLTDLLEYWRARVRG